jgi:hypothetical protein
MARPIGLKAQQSLKSVAKGGASVVGRGLQPSHGYEGVSQEVTNGANTVTRELSPSVGMTT